MAKQTCKKRKENGLCPLCAIPWAGTTHYCKSCTEYQKQRQRQRHLKFKGNCSRCLARPPSNGFKYCEPCQLGSKNAGKKQRQKHREIVISAYGGKCTCCGKLNNRVLQLDHVNNDGKFHRKQVHTTMFKWAIKNNFPPTLQLLCADCHMIKTIYGKCLSTDHLICFVQ